MEGSTRGGVVLGLLTSFVRFVLFVALGGENSRAGRVARPESERWGGVESARGGAAAVAQERRWQCLRCMTQESELREGSVQRGGPERRQSHWPFAAGADPAASSGVPPAMALD
eukprot:162047-Pleurochrysis_carterae.AAC.1